MRKQILQFVAGAVGIGAAGLVAAVGLGGAELAVPVLAAFGLTAVPALATMLWAGVTFRSAPDMLLLAGLGGSAVRMVVALGGGLALAAADRQTFGPAFLLTLATFYLLVLALEITLLVRGQPASENGT